MVLINDIVAIAIHELNKKCIFFGDFLIILCKY